MTSDVPPPPGLPDRPGATWRRRLVLPALALGAVCLVPWAVYLSTTLDRTYTAHQWREAWVIFDLVLAAVLGSAAVLAWRRRLVFVIPTIAAGTMLLADAWFDIMLARGGDLDEAIWSALLEVPCGLFLLALVTQQIRRLHRGALAVGWTPRQLVELGSRPAQRSFSDKASID